jgi:type II secretory pathway component PulF
MAKFDYQARNHSGSLQSGTVEAASLENAVSILQRHGLIIVSLDPQRKKSLFDYEINIFNKVKNKDVVIFSRQLAILFEAQVPIVESFEALINQTEKASFRMILSDILNDIEGGMSLSKALSRYPNIFSHFYISMIKSGEASGKLQEVFSYLADHTERSYYLLSKIRGAMMYPAFIIGAFVVVGFLMMLFVVPQLTSVLEETGQDLPFTTKILIGASNIVKDWFWGIIILPIIAAIGLWRYQKTPRGKEAMDEILVRIPVIGNLLKKVYLSRFAENLSTLVKGGLPIIQALRVTGDVITNQVYSNIIIEAIEEIKGGGNISTTLSKYPKEFPRFVTQMVLTGEKTGKLAKVLENVSDFYQREVDNMTGNLTQLIEPVLIVILGIGVGGLVSSILVPIYNIAGGI